MDALIDITAQTSNTIKRRSNSSIGYHALKSQGSMEKENLVKSRSPHFMTPTLSSSKQSVITQTENDGRDSMTLPSRPIKAEGSNAWMKSAVKRVGFRRAGDGNPRSRRESPLKQVNGMSFSDKLAIPSYTKIPDFPPSTQKQVSRMSPRDKPLPTPPIAQVDGSSAITGSKSLIDVSDKTLRRSSPPCKAEPEDDRPVLDPIRPSSPGNLLRIMHATGSKLTQQAVFSEKERYPILSNPVRQVPSDDHTPVSSFSATYKNPGKAVSSPNLGGESENYRTEVDGKRSIDDPFRDGVYESGPVLPAKDLPTSPSGLSAAGHAATAAATEKAAQETKPFIEPRQTRTSSLRARLSAGHIAKDRQTKIVGFTDFTAPAETASIVRRDSLRARKEAQACRSITPLACNTLNNKASRESVRSNRAPAQFVGGSRRPAHPRRPSSCGSLRNESRVPTPPLPPIRPPPARLESEARDMTAAKELTDNHLGQSISSQKSSIPIPRLIADYATLGTEHNNTGPTLAKKEPRSEFGIYQDCSSADLVSDLETTPPPTAKGKPAPFLLGNHDSSVLEAIEESPQHAYRLKRLSFNSPDFGPTLRISPSAQRFIMGPGLDEENRSPTKKESKELDHAMMRVDSKTPKADKKPVAATKDKSQRPSSSQGFSRFTSCVGLIDPKLREKKVKSADLDDLSALERVQGNPIKQSGHSRPNYLDVSAKILKSSTNTSNNPFFDAAEEPFIGPQDVKSSSQAEQKQQCTMDEAPWISPLKEPTDISGDKVLILDDHLPTSLQEEYKGHTKEMKRSQNVNIVVESLTKQLEEAKDAPTEKQPPSTPEGRQAKKSQSSGSYPPRSSSRLTPPDFSGSKARSSSPFSTEKPPPTPLKDLPNDFSRRQNRLGSLRGHESAQMDLTNPGPKHDSAARDSYKSQNSVSKGVLSNFRGLFHKLSSEINEPLRSGKKAKSKVSIAANGSPFPPNSEIHPIYRPTLASMNRSNGQNPRPSTSAIPVTPSFASPIPSEVSTTTTLAMQILESARNEHSSPKKERLLELGKVMVDVITQARDAEKAMEEAKQAARQAEVAHALCKKSLGQVEKYVREWRSDIGR